MATQAQNTSPSAGLVEVDRLLAELDRNLVDAKLSLKKQEELLARVKILGRNQDTAGPIFLERGISVLSKYGFDQTASVEASREALRCLANAFLLFEPSRQIFVDLDYARKAAERLNTDSPDDEFLISRILFYLTYNPNVDFKLLVSAHSLTESINQNILRHARSCSTTGRKESVKSPMQDMAMVETAKLMFNLTAFYPETVPKFTSSVEPLIDIIIHHDLQLQPLQPPITSIINALLNLDLKAIEERTPLDGKSRSSLDLPYSEPASVVERFVKIFDAALRNQPEKDLELTAAPLCTILRRLYELGSPQMQLSMRRLLLPTAEDRDKPLGQGQTFPSRLLRLSTSPSVPTLRENISGLLFELSDKDATKFIKNIGYGFASGFLMSHNIAVPSSAMDTNSAPGGGDVDAYVDINPITGQRLSAENRDSFVAEDMTEEEKEREAEKLFVLFERLRATGVVDVKNPVQQAIDDGRFEELDG